MFGEDIKWAKFDKYSCYISDRYGGSHEREESGFYATVLQHEVDHLNGVMFVDRMVADNTLSCQEMGHLLLS